MSIDGHPVTFCGAYYTALLELRESENAVLLPEIDNRFAAYSLASFTLSYRLTVFVLIIEVRPCESRSKQPF